MSFFFGFADELVKVAVSEKLLRRSIGRAIKKQREVLDETGLHPRLQEGLKKVIHMAREREAGKIAKSPRLGWQKETHKLIPKHYQGRRPTDLPR